MYRNKINDIDVIKWKNGFTLSVMPTIILKAIRDIIMTNQPSHSLKEEFKKWLEQQGYKSSVVKDYAYRVQHMVNDLSKSDWSKFSDNVIPLLTAFYEIANKEYYLDRVTAWYALDYFDKISQNIKNLRNYNPRITLQLFDGTEKNRDFYSYEFDFIELSKHLKCLTKNMYDYHVDYSHDFHDYALIQDFEENSIVQLQDAAIHITYDTKRNSQHKTVLSRYCDFLYAVTSDSLYDHKSNSTLYMVKNRNPNKIIKENYKEKQPLTGKQPLQIEIKGESIPYYHNYSHEEDTPPTDFILVKEDLSKILNLDPKTIKKYFVSDCFKSKIAKKRVNPKQIEKEWKIKLDTTVIRDYFSIASTNEFLVKGHKQVTKPNQGVNYDCKGYKYWITRVKATNILDISHNQFDFLINGENCVRLAYIPECTKYYSPDIKFLKNDKEVRKSHFIKEKLKNKYQRVRLIQ